MANLILRDRNGEIERYDGIETVTFNSPSGNTVTFFDKRDKSNAWYTIQEMIDSPAYATYTFVSTYGKFVSSAIQGFGVWLQTDDDAFQIWDQRQMYNNFNQYDKYVFFWSTTAAVDTNINGVIIQSGGANGLYYYDGSQIVQVAATGNGWARVQLTAVTTVPTTTVVSSGPSLTLASTAVGHYFYNNGTTKTGVILVTPTISPVQVVPSLNLETYGYYYANCVSLKDSDFFVISGSSTLGYLAYQAPLILNYKTGACTKFPNTPTNTSWMSNYNAMVKMSDTKYFVYINTNSTNYAPQVVDISTMTNQFIDPTVPAASPAPLRYHYSITPQGWSDTKIIYRWGNTTTVNQAGTYAISVYDTTTQKSTILYDYQNNASSPIPWITSFNVPSFCRNGYAVHYYSNAIWLVNANNESITQFTTQGYYNSYSYVWEIDDMLIFAAQSSGTNAAPLRVFNSLNGSVTELTSINAYYAYFVRLTSNTVLIHGMTNDLRLCMYTIGDSSLTTVATPWGSSTSSTSWCDVGDCYIHSSTSSAYLGAYQVMKGTKDVRLIPGSNVTNGYYWRDSYMYSFGTNNGKITIIGSAGYAYAFIYVDEFLNASYRPTAGNYCTYWYKIDEDTIMGYYNNQVYFIDLLGNVLRQATSGFSFMAAAPNTLRELGRYNGLILFGATTTTGLYRLNVDTCQSVQLLNVGSDWRRVVDVTGGFLVTTPTPGSTSYTDKGIYFVPDDFAYATQLYAKGYNWINVRADTEKEGNFYLDRPSNESNTRLYWDDVTKQITEVSRS